MESSDILTNINSETGNTGLLPIVESLDHDRLPTSKEKSLSARSRVPSDTLKTMKAQTTLIEQLQTSLHITQEALRDSENNKAEVTALLHAQLHSPGHTPILETPGPHRLLPRASRPEDSIYNEQMMRGTRPPSPPAQPHQPPQQNSVLDIVTQLARAMKDANTSDITEPSKFSGEDHHWDEFHYQLRTYLAAKKGWLHVYDHHRWKSSPRPRYEYYQPHRSLRKVVYPNGTQRPSKPS